MSPLPTGLPSDANTLGGSIEESERGGSAYQHVNPVPWPLRSGALLVTKSLRASHSTRTLDLRELVVLFVSDRLRLSANKSELIGCCRVINVRTCGALASTSLVDHFSRCLAIWRHKVRVRTSCDFAILRSPVTVTLRVWQTVRRPDLVRQFCRLSRQALNLTITARRDTVKLRSICRTQRRILLRNGVDVDIFGMRLPVARRRRVFVDAFGRQLNLHSRVGVNEDGGSSRARRHPPCTRWTRGAVAWR